MSLERQKIIFLPIIDFLGAKCKSTWDGETAGYECEGPEKMFVLQSGGEQGHSWNNGPLKLHRFGLAEENGKAGRIG